MPKKPEMLSLHRVYKDQLIPWATNRKTVTRLFTENKVRHVVVGTPKRKRYYTTRAWIETYLHKTLKVKK